MSYHEQSAQDHMNGQIDRDSEIDAANDTYDEMYRIECEEANKRIAETNKSTFERFRDRFIDKINLISTKIN